MYMSAIIKNDYRKMSKIKNKTKFNYNFFVNCLFHLSYLVLNESNKIIFDIFIIIDEQMVIMHQN